MVFSKLATGFAIATSAAAITHPMITREAPHILLAPAVHPSVDPSDVSNIQAQQGAVLHYDSNADPQVDSTTITLSTSRSDYPVVQVENSQYIKSINCSSDSAQIEFSDQNAFATAAKSWGSAGQFIMISHDPKCGSGYAAGKRDFALVKSMTTDPTGMTVDAEISFVDYQTTIGKEALVTSKISQYTAVDSGAPSKRTTESETISWNEYPTSSLTDSQWGPGYQLYSGADMDLICVNCGTQGSMTLTGTVTWSVTDGITGADVSISGAMSVTMEVGMDAKGLSESIPIGSISLAQIPLAAIDVPDIMTIGPQLDISASASATISATGSMLAGATLNWPSVAATLVLDGSGSTSGSGWSPTTSPVSTVQGSISATLNLDLPVELGIGVNLLDGEFNKNIGIIDTPGLQLTAQASTSGACTGVDLSADAVNNVVGDVLGVTTIPIASFTTALYSTCIGGGAPAPPTTTPASQAVAEGKVAEKVRQGRRYRQVS